MTADDIAKGPNTTTGPADGPWTVTSSKGDGVQRITNVSRPTLTVFPAPKHVPSTSSGQALSGAEGKEKAAPAPAMIVCPGGGYSYVVYDKEGMEIAAWLNSAGITALVLKYRVPNNRGAAFLDVQRALRVASNDPDGWRGLGPKERHRVLARVALQLRRARGELIGAVGTSMPEVEMQTVDDGGHVITFSTGMMAFVYAVIRAQTADSTLAAVEGFRQIIDRYGVHDIRAVATSAVREARNGGEFLARIERETGIRPRVITGVEEARLILADFRQAVARMPELVERVRASHERRAVDVPPAVVARSQHRAHRRPRPQHRLLVAARGLPAAQRRTGVLKPVRQQRRAALTPLQGLLPAWRLIARRVALRVERRQMYLERRELTRCLAGGRNQRLHVRGGRHRGRPPHQVVQQNARLARGEFLYERTRQALPFRNAAQRGAKRETAGENGSSDEQQRGRRQEPGGPDMRRDFGRGLDEVADSGRSSSFVESGLFDSRPDQQRAVVPRDEIAALRPGHTSERWTGPGELQELTANRSHRNTRAHALNVDLARPAAGRGSP